MSIEKMAKDLINKSRSSSMTAEENLREAIRHLLEAGKKLYGPHHCKASGASPPTDAEKRLLFEAALVAKELHDEHNP